MDVAVIGCGYWGPNLIRNFASLNQEGRVLCCDTDPGRLRRIKQLYPLVGITPSYEAILRNEGVGAVAIATPVATHYELAKAALLAGKDVLLEKPLAASTEQCQELIALAARDDRVLMAGHTFEYSPAVSKIRELVKAGDIGDVLYFSFTRVNLGLFQKDINVMWDLAPHDLSILLSVHGKEPVAVNAVGQAHFREDIEDVATATLHFDRGEIALIHVSWLDPCKIRRMTVVGTRKMLVYDDVEVNEKIKIFDKGIETPPHYDTFADFHFSYRYGDILIPRVENQEPLKLECQHFLDCVKSRAKPRTDGESGARVVRLLEAISESMRNAGARVELANRPRWARSPAVPPGETRRLAERRPNS